MKVDILKTPRWFVNLQYIFFISWVIYYVINYKTVIYQFTRIDPNTLVLLILILVLHFFHVFYHEYTHFYLAKALKYRSKVFIKAKVCIVKGNIKPIHFSVIVISPFILDLFITLFLIYTYPGREMFISLLFVVFIGSSTSDIYLFFKSLKYSKRKKLYLKYAGQSEFKIIKV